MAWAGVTERVRYGTPDDDCLPLTRCLCGPRVPALGFRAGRLLGPGDAVCRVRAALLFQQPRARLRLAGGGRR